MNRTETNKKVNEIVTKISLGQASAEEVLSLAEILTKSKFWLNLTELQGVGYLEEDENEFGTHTLGKYDRNTKRINLNKEDLGKIGTSGEGFLNFLNTISHEAQHHYQDRIFSLIKTHPRFEGQIGARSKSIIRKFDNQASLTPQNVDIILKSFPNLFSEKFLDSIKGIDFARICAFGQYLNMAYEADARLVGLQGSYLFLNRFIQICEDSGVKTYLSSQVKFLEEAFKQEQDFQRIGAVYENFKAELSKISTQELFEFNKTFFGGDSSADSSSFQNSLLSNLLKEKTYLSIMQTLLENAQKDQFVKLKDFAIDNNFDLMFQAVLMSAIKSPKLSASEVAELKQNFVHDIINKEVDRSFYGDFLIQNLNDHETAILINGLLEKEKIECASKVVDAICYYKKNNAIKEILPTFLKTLNSYVDHNTSDKVSFENCLALANICSSLKFQATQVPELISSQDLKIIQSQNQAISLISQQMKSGSTKMVIPEEFKRKQIKTKINENN